MESSGHAIIFILALINVSDLQVFIFSSMVTGVNIKKLLFFNLKLIILS